MGPTTQFRSSPRGSHLPPDDDGPLGEDGDAAAVGEARRECHMMICLRGAVMVCVQCTSPVPVQPPDGPPTVTWPSDRCHAAAPPDAAEPTPPAAHPLCSPITKRT